MSESSSCFKSSNFVYVELIDVGGTVLSVARHSISVKHIDRNVPLSASYFVQVYGSSAR